MTEQLTPATLRALVAHRKGTPAEYIVRRVDVTAHAAAWESELGRLQALVEKQRAALNRIAQCSDKSDDFEWYGTGLNACIPAGIDESNAGDWHDHGYNMGVWSQAMTAREALEQEKQP